MEPLIIFAASNKRPHGKTTVPTQGARFGKNISFLTASEVRKKIFANITKVQYGVKNGELLKKLKGSDIWEFRTLYEGPDYRLFAFWDKGQETLVVATHGIEKKSQKTPKKEIIRAEEIRQRYFENLVK